MNNNIRNLASQQTQGGQRNVDKDGIFLTENYGGLNTESSPMNMPLQDSPALMNVEVQTSGKLVKRKGSRYMNSGIGVIDQLVPVKLSNGELIFVLQGNTGITIQPDTYDNAQSLYVANNVFPSESYNNTSYVTTSSDDTTYVHFARAGSPPIVLEICEVATPSVDDDVVIPRKFSGTYRDTSKVTNCKFLDVSGAWHSFTSINTSTGDGVLASTPAVDGVGLFVHFHWHWVAQTEWRDKNHLQFNFVRTFDSPTSCSVELSSKFKQMVINQLSIATAQKYAQNNGGSRVGAVSGTSLDYLTDELFISRATGTTGSTANPSPQISATNPPGTWWANDGTRPLLGANSTVSGPVASTDVTDYYTVFPSHILFGGNWYTDAGYTVPAPPSHRVVFNAMYIGFDAGTGTTSAEVTADTNRVTVSIVPSASWQTTGYAMRLDKIGGAGYTVPATASDQTGLWLSAYCGANSGLIGDSFRITKFTVPTGAGSGAVAGANMLGTSKTDAYYYTEYGLLNYMNYKSGAYASVVGKYQDRLCYAGFVSNAGTLLFSNTGTSDETFYGQKNPHMNFDVMYSDPELSTSPLSINLNLQGGESIVAMQQWYDDLFVGTNLGVYRIHGGDNVAITPSNFFVSKVSNVGTIINGMVLTVDGVVFLSDSGVYKIFLDANTNSYNVTNIGLKIRPEIKKGMSSDRFFNSVGRLSYDATANVLYVLVGDEFASAKPRRCFVYYADREAWTEWSMYNGFMNAQGVACIDGRVFMCITGSSSTYATMCEFNMSDYYTDANALVVLSDATDSGYDLDVPLATFTRSNYIADSNPVLNFGGVLKVPPIMDSDNVAVVSQLSGAGVNGTDFWRHKGNVFVVEGSTFFAGADTLYASMFQEESNYRVLNVYSLADEDYLGLTDLDYTDDMNVQAAVGSGYDGETVMLSLSYPTWWISPAFTRNDIKDLKRMNHFYGIFENSVPAGNNTYTDASWDTLNSFNMSIIQNGTGAGQVVNDNLASSDIRDLSAQAPAWLDYFRVSLPIKGNFISFQACIHSFDRGQWEMVGYQVETNTEGRTSRRAYNE